MEYDLASRYAVCTLLCHVATWGKWASEELIISRKNSINMDSGPFKTQTKPLIAVCILVAPVNQIFIKQPNVIRLHSGHVRGGKDTSIHLHPSY